MAVNRVLDLGFYAPFSVITGLITAIVGVILRDLLTNHPATIMRKEMEATPILLELITCISLHLWVPNSVINVPLCIATTFLLRCFTIRFQWQYPNWLCCQS